MRGFFRFGQIHRSHVLTLERLIIGMCWHFRREEHRVHGTENGFTISFSETMFLHIL